MIGSNNDVRTLLNPDLEKRQSDVCGWGRLVVTFLRGKTCEKPIVWQINFVNKRNVETYNVIHK